MIQYQKDDTIGFGKYEGYTIREIYQYDPSYIEWLIKFTDDIILDLHELRQLTVPTPYLSPHNYNLITSYFKRIQNFRTGVNHVKEALQYEKETGKKLKAEAFIFKPEILEIIELKENGTYQKPKWEKLDLSRPENQATFAD